MAAPDLHATAIRVLLGALTILEPACQPTPVSSPPPAPPVSSAASVTTALATASSAGPDAGADTAVAVDGDAGLADEASAESPLWAEPGEWVEREHLPKGLQVFPSLFDDPRPRSCGPYQVRQRVDQEKSVLILTLHAADGSVAKELEPAGGLGGWSPEWCFDVTGDGNPELMVDEGTGGAHCCHTYHLYELSPRIREILVHRAGNGAFGVWPRDLDGKGAYELMGRNDALAVLGSSAYAFAPFLPEVFAWDNGRYHRRTSRFKDFLRAERAKVEARAAKECDAGDASCWQALGEELLGLSLFIGDWPAYSRGSPIPKSTLTELEKLRPKLARVL